MLHGCLGYRQLGLTQYSGQSELPHLYKNKTFLPIGVPPACCSHVYVCDHCSLVMSDFLMHVLMSVHS